MNSGGTNGVPSLASGGGTGVAGGTMNLWPQLWWWWREGSPLKDVHKRCICESEHEVQARSAVDAETLLTKTVLFIVHIYCFVNEGNNTIALYHLHILPSPM